ncbi:MAG: DsbA family protein [Acidobacteria bacterium]|nr:DsbA family protein [Acidobacteriota bacterium]
MNHAVCTRTTLALLMLVAATAAAQEQPTPPPAPSAMPGQAAPSASPGQKVVASYSLGDVTEAELDRVVAPSLAQLKSQEYQIKEKAIRQIVAERLLRAAALKAGQTRDQYYAEQITSKVVDPPKERVDQILKQYGARIPGTEDQKRERVVEALKQQQTQQLETALKDKLLAGADLQVKLEPPRFPVAIDPTDPTRGPADAPVTIVEFSDFQCPFCARSQTTLTKLWNEYPGKLRMVFKDMPSPGHPRARPAAEAAACAQQQGKFWELYEWLFQNQKDLSDDAIAKEAKALGLDMDAFNACLSKHEADQQINADLREAQLLGATGTPTFFINGRMLSGAQPASEFESIINDELAHAGTAAKTGQSAQQEQKSEGEGPSPGKVVIN